MPPKSPLPPRYGLNAAWLRTPDRSASPEWSSMGQWLRHRLPEHVEIAEMLAAERFVYDDLRPVREDDPYAPHTFMWFHRDLREEVQVPGELRILHRDDRLVVVDKPAFLATIPRGKHVQQSVVVRLRDELGLPELSPMHRLDRVTSGVLMLATERRWRAAYQLMFEHRQVTKTYLALAGYREELGFPLTVRNHLHKEPGIHQARVVPRAPVNAETTIELVRRDGEHAVYRLSPRTGKTHQLRLHLAGLGIPIVDDPLYPYEWGRSVDDFSRPLQLLASELAFTDPMDSSERRFVSERELPLLAAQE